MAQEQRSEDQCHYTESSKNQAVLSDLRRATQYEVQVRANTTVGYGSFSTPALFRTLPDGKEEEEEEEAVAVAAAAAAASHSHSLTHSLKCDFSFFSHSLCFIAPKCFRFFFTAAAAA